MKFLTLFFILKFFYGEEYSNLIKCFLLFSCLLGYHVLLLSLSFDTFFFTFSLNFFISLSCLVKYIFLIRNVFRNCLKWLYRQPPVVGAIVNTAAVLQHWRNCRTVQGFPFGMYTVLYCKLKVNKKYLKKFRYLLNKVLEFLLIIVKPIGQGYRIQVVPKIDL